jgi:DNA-binding transcriptional ArsR family regulator
MGVWRVGADGLARSRFTVSPLAETLAALFALDEPGPPPDDRRWVREHAADYRARLDADPVAALFVRAALGPKWLPDFVFPTPQDDFPTPRDDDRTFHDELRRVRQTPPEAALADVAAGLPGPVPAGLRVPDLPYRVADLLDWVWSSTVRPDWPRRRRLLEADIVSRTQRLSTGGWAAALDGMRPGMRWLGDGQLQINAYDNPPRNIGDASLLFVPSSTRRGWVGWEHPHRYAVVYPCSGLLADPAADVPPHALSRLLGPVRANVLHQLAEPRSPTQLVALTGYGLGTVGGQLRVLLDAQLVRRRRSGRSVLYYRTTTGDLLVAAQTRDDVERTIGVDEEQAERLGPGA